MELLITISRFLRHFPVNFHSARTNKTRWVSIVSARV